MDYRYKEADMEIVKCLKRYKTSLDKFNECPLNYISKSLRIFNKSIYTDEIVQTITEEVNQLYKEA